MPDRSLAAAREAVLSVVEPTALEQRVPFGRLVERASRRRHRRWQVAGGVAACLLTAGALLGTAANSKVDAPPATPSPSTSLPATPSNQLLVQSIYFATPSLGYAVVERCAGPGYRCAAHASVLRTKDGAHTWERVSNPTDTAAGEQVRVEEATSSGGVVLSVGELRYSSPDYGVTWQQSAYAPVMGPPTGAVPAGWDAVAVEGEVGALDPVSNQFRPLTHQPAFTQPVNMWAQRSGPGGRILAMYDDETRLYLAYSDDQGRSWHDQAVPGSAGSRSRMILTGPGSNRIYLTQGDVDYRVMRIYRLDNPGGSWIPVPVPERVRVEQPPGSLKAIQSLPNGELLFAFDPPMFTEHNGATVVDAPQLRVYGASTQVLAPNQAVGDVLVSTLPAGIDQPSGVVPVLFSTDSGHTWELRESHL